ncbi:Sensor_kinase_SpoOB-type, alpha-helical domain [Caloranaerobacter azorensis DSM 13643]|uniref:Sensor_kinase_SpoOB-type, alpha-helical domain n=1 Tax=Caloranaerobacter azorensis DSM 13643 TaxID=1121264 RepID=A0A1M5SIF6_9FIRM|nr:GHKL domain-containing protein [Caloranaerobacter azorensis]SHH38245.1 Sensor_kinase_SpoOB-type, alpha-helical domain [Caloranaerobacter azorensis DSM 13643]
MNNKYLSLKTVVAFNIISVFLLTLFIINNFLVSNQIFQPIDIRIFNLIFGLFIVLLNVLDIFIIRELFNHIKKDYMYKLKQIELINMREMNDLVREQRHDLLNHMQIIYGLLKLKKYDRLEEYLLEFGKETEKLKPLVNTGVPEVDILLQFKINKALRLNIDVDLTIKCKIDNLKINPFDLNKILSNLLDNAIDATLELEEDKRFIGVNMFQTPMDYIFTIENSCKLLEKHTLNRIFEKNFSTKGTSRGMGLYIVKKIVEKNNGEITVDSAYDKVIFTVMFPKN